MCDNISQFDTKSINILALTSFWITIIVSILITMGFSAYMGFFYTVKQKAYWKEEDLAFNEEDPFDFNDWYILTEQDMGDVLWD